MALKKEASQAKKPKDIDRLYTVKGEEINDPKAIMDKLKTDSLEELRNSEKKRKNKENRAVKTKRIIKDLSFDIAKMVFILCIVAFTGLVFDSLGFKEDTIITVFVLGVLLVAVFTSNRIYSLISSVISVVVFSYLFAAPTFDIHFSDQEYVVTFIIMFLASSLTGSLASKLKENAKLSARAAFRTKVLFDTNQLLQTSKDEGEIVSNSALQLLKLLDKDIIVYIFDGKDIDDGKVFTRDRLTSEKPFLTDEEKKAAIWCCFNNSESGCGTDVFHDVKCLYYPISVNDNVYGTIGIKLEGSTLEPFQNSIFQSILGECAFALANVKIAREKEEAAVLAKNEQLRANLLRAISHDLRTPLTSISGNASNLLYNGESFDEDTKKQLYGYIYDDSMWLINLVENLLSVTRLEEGRLNINISENLVDEVIAESLNHVNRLKSEHNLTYRCEDDLLLAKMDAKLIVQVIINIVDNAIKYTPVGSNIEVTAKKEEDNFVHIFISDNGPGIPDALKPRIFDMFYSGANKIADCRRSLGLGLSLCRSIINAHGGKITVYDNKPQGTVFEFTLPAGEVNLHE